MSAGETVVISSLHGGPPGIGHGGYVAGLLTRHIDGAAQVTLRRPAPLDTDLAVAQTEDGWALQLGDDVIADAIAAKLELEVPTPPSLDEARAAAAGDGSPSRWHQKTACGPTCGACTRPKTFFSTAGNNCSFS